MKNKYYYNGQLVRTSKNEYTHAIYYNDNLIACCGSHINALKRLKSEVNYVTNPNICSYAGWGKPINASNLKIVELKKVNA